MIAEVSKVDTVMEGERVSQPEDTLHHMKKASEPPASGFSSFVQRRETQQSGYRNSPLLNSSSSEDSNASDDEEDNMMWRSKRQRHSRQIAACGDNKPFFNPNRETLNSPPRPVRMPSKNGAGGFKRNNIWGSVLQEQTVTEGLNRQIKVDRASDSESEESDNVESYNYKLAWKDSRPYRKHSDSDGEGNQQDSIHKAVEKETFGNEQPISRKRPYPSRKNRAQRGNVKERLGERTYDKDKPRPHIDVTAEDSVPKLVNCLCNILEEPKVDLITRVVQTLGNQKALELLYMTEDVEAAGGLMTLDGSRRRTPGGTYLQLMRTDPKVTPEQIKEIFKEERQFFHKRKKKNQKKHREWLQRKTAKEIQRMEEDAGDEQDEEHVSQVSLLEGAPSAESPNMEILPTASHEQADKTAIQGHHDLEDYELEDGEIPD